MLAEHPRILKQLRDEILERVGPNRRPAFEDFKEMKYMRAFLNGMTFLLPSSPG